MKEKTKKDKPEDFEVCRIDGKKGLWLYLPKEYCVSKKIVEGDILELGDENPEYDETVDYDEIYDD
ncbi:MAG: hypothetical protein QXF35_04055 [Candidatus Bilamarchaeaceae archaeon]